VLEILVIAACGEQGKALRDELDDLGGLLGVIQGGRHQHVEQLDVLGLVERGALICVQLLKLFHDLLQTPHIEGVISFEGLYGCLALDPHNHLPGLFLEQVCQSFLITGLMASNDQYVRFEKPIIVLYAQVEADVEVTHHIVGDYRLTEPPNQCEVESEAEHFDCLHLVQILSESGQKVKHRLNRALYGPMLEVEVNVQRYHELREQPPELFLLGGRLHRLVLCRF
jgi:hypothetical protein